MANPSSDVYCITIVNLSNICIPMPGGAVICPFAGFDMGDPMQVIKSLMGAINTALAPLSPFFKILDVALKLFACVKAIPDMFLKFPPGPQPLIKCIPALVEAINDVLQLIPFLSIPPMVRAILTALILFLQAFENKIKAYLNRLIQIAAAEARAATLPNPGKQQLIISLSCAKAALKNQMSNMQAGFGPVNQLIQVVSAFMQLAGLGCIPAIGNIGPLSDALFAPIDVIIAILTFIRDAIPDLGALVLDIGDC